MCGRFVQTPLLAPEDVPWPELARDFANIRAQYNLAPTQRAAVVLGRGGELEMRRMPVFLDPQQAREWMTADSEGAMGMLMAAPVPELRIVRVGREINSSRNRGGPESIEPVD